MRSGLMAPAASLLSQVPSNVVPSLVPPWRTAAFLAEVPSVPEVCGWGLESLTGSGVAGVDASDGERESGLIVAVTRAHSSISSGLSDRTRCTAFRQKNKRLPGRSHAASNNRRFGACAPKGVESVRAFDSATGILRDPKSVRFRAI